MEEFDEFIDVLDYVETLTGEVVKLNTEEPFNV